MISSGTWPPCSILLSRRLLISSSLATQTMGSSISGNASPVSYIPEPDDPFMWIRLLRARRRRNIPDSSTRIFHLPYSPSSAHDGFGYCIAVCGMSREEVLKVPCHPPGTTLADQQQLGQSPDDRHPGHVFRSILNRAVPRLPRYLSRCAIALLLIYTTFQMEMKLPVRQKAAGWFRIFTLRPVFRLGSSDSHANA